MADKGNGSIHEGFELEKLIAELDAIKAASVSAVDRPDRTYRLEEIATGLGCGNAKARRTVKRWIAEGLCNALYAPHKNMWGIVQSVPMIQFTVGNDITK